MNTDILAIDARDLVKRYGDLIAVDGVTLQVERAQCVGLLGPNGAGKTTAIEMLVGLREPDEGHLEILGRKWSAVPEQIQELIGVQLQETQLPEKNTVWELLNLFASFYTTGQSPADVLQLIGLREKRNRRVEKLSGGQRQRLTLGCAIIHNPEILFLDEPTTGLDPQARRNVWAVIENFKKAGGTIVLTTHYMDEAERLSDRLVILDRGRILQEGSPRQIITSLQADRVVEFALEGAMDSAREQIQALPGVQSVRQVGEQFALTVEETQGSLSALLDWVRENNLHLTDLSTHRATLDDVFVSLTGRHLRDGQEPRDPPADEGARPSPSA